MGREIPALRAKPEPKLIPSGGVSLFCRAFCSGQMPSCTGEATVAGGHPRFNQDERHCAAVISHRKRPVNVAAILMCRCAFSDWYRSRAKYSSEWRRRTRGSIDGRTAWRSLPASSRKRPRAGTCRKCSSAFRWYPAPSLQTAFRGITTTVLCRMVHSHTLTS